LQRTEVSVGEDVEKVGFLPTVGGKKNQYGHCIKQCGSPTKNCLMIYTLHVGKKAQNTS
jgi:hypothetical protein